MSDQFLRLANEDISTIRSAIGARSVGSGETRDRGNTYYVEINQNVLRELFEFFTVQETDFGLAEDMLDSFSLRNGVQFYFLGEELDDEDYGIVDHMTNLMRRARQWYHVCGFVPLRDTSAVLDRRLREEVEVDSAQNAATSGSSSVSELSRVMLARAEAIVERAVPTNRGDLLRRVANVFGFRARGSSRVQSAIAASGVRSDNATLPAVDILNERNVPARLRERAQATIVTRPRVESTREPSADLRIEQPNGESSAQPGDSAARKRNTDIGRTASETRENKRRRAQQNSSRTLRQAITDLRNLEIPDLSEGRFYVEVDTVTGKRRVVFVARRDALYAESNVKANSSVIQREFFNSYGTASDSDGIRRHASVHIDRDVTVYVWQKRMPDPDGRIKTRLFEVLRMRRILDMAEQNLAEVDWKLAHPTTVLEQQPPPSNAHRDEMLDQQLYGGDAADATPSTEERVRQDAVARFVTSVETQVANGRMRSALAHEIAERGTGATQRDGRGNQRELTIGNTLQPFLLPPMVRVTGSAPTPTTAIDVNFFHFRYDEKKANVFGLPPQKLSGGTSYTGRGNNKGSGGASANTNDASYSLVDDQTRKAVLDDRKMLEEFVQAAVWDNRFREIDNETLEETLRRESDRTASAVQPHIEFMEMIERKLAVVIDIAERESLEGQMLEEAENIATLTARLDDIDREVKQKLAMRYRFEVKFNNMSFASPQELQALAQDNVITELEKVNALRAMYGKEDITEAEFMSQIEANQKVAEKQAEFEMKVETERATEMAKIAEKYGQKPAAPSVGSSSVTNKSASGGESTTTTSAAKKTQSNAQKSDAANKK